MPYVMYVALQGDDKFARFPMAPTTGKLTLQEEVPVAGGPAPLAVDPHRNTCSKIQITPSGRAVYAQGVLLWSRTENAPH